MRVRARNISGAAFDLAAATLWVSGTTTPRLALPYIAVGQAQKELANSQGMNRTDALRQATVQQVGLNTPPGSPTEGQAWIVGTAPTGAWSTWANRLVQRVDGAWISFPPFAGLTVYDAATLAAWAWNGSAWVVTGPRIIDGSATYDPPNIAAGTGVTTAVALTGATLGDFVRASFSLDLQGITLTEWVSAAGTVSARFQNRTSGALDMASGTLRVRVEKVWATTI